MSPDEIVRGFQTDEGKVIVVTDEELDSVAPGMSRDIELRRFVPMRQIPPIYYQRPYLLAPTGRSTKAYHLLAETMKKTARAGIGTFVMRGHQYRVAILSDGALLRAETLRFADELRSKEELDLPGRQSVPARTVRRMEKAISSLKRDALDLEELSDRYADSLQEIVAAKQRAGRDVVTLEPQVDDEPPEDTADIIDLVQILKRRLAATERAPGKGAGKQAKRGRRGEAGREGQDGRDGRRPQSREGLDKLSKQDLYGKAQSLKLPGRSKMGRRELINALSAA